MCKSHVNVNHLHLHVWTFYNYIYTIVVYIYSFTLTQGQCKYLLNTFTWPYVNVLKCVTIYIKVIRKVTLSLVLLSRNLIKYGYDMVKFSIYVQGSKVTIIVVQVKAMKINANTTRIHDLSNHIIWLHYPFWPLNIFILIRNSSVK
jgi:hypothetical protein